MSHERFQSSIDACVACAVECEHCVSECLNENDSKMLIHCINLNRECASICRSAAELMAIGGQHSRRLWEVCAEICDACAVECEKHRMDHCELCAAQCRVCAEACRKMTMQYA